MRGLLDVSVLVALFDEAHTFNERAHQWLEDHGSGGIATCPLTENGVVRILSNANYSRVFQFSASHIVHQLRSFVDGNEHQFWPDEVSLRDATHFDPVFILGPSQVTDLYLLALATEKGGCFVTFDTAIHLGAVPRATPANLCVI